MRDYLKSGYLRPAVSKLGFLWGELKFLAKLWEGVGRRRLLRTWILDLEGYKRNGKAQASSTNSFKYGA